ncbi:multidrug efflux MFS transporter [Streptococcus pluranimalium]|uniref:multidrug efflux MFS transporter n=1 Tax=Streptococcus pluranimalium TaxID=82348 RepID=UPI003BF89F59
MIRIPIAVDWKKNLKIAWFGSFLAGASFSLVMPFMPLYVERLGAKPGLVELYSGLAVSLSALASGLFAPMWGRLADRYGRKPMMIRASFVMTLTMGGLAFVPSVFWLLVLRILNGMFAGFIPNSNALIASQAPQDKTGYALGTLATGVIGGSLIGPLFGGFLAELVGIKNVFLLVGFLLLMVCLMTIFMIEEDFKPVARVDAWSTKELFDRIKDKQMLVGLFVTSMIIQISAQSVAPILTLYIRHLGQTENLMFVSGAIVSAMGFSSMISSSRLGKAGDRIGNHRLILMGLLYCSIIYLFLARSETSLELGIWRFLFGFGTGALMPSVNALLTRLTPKEGISRIFAYNQMFTNFGQVIGPFVGSAVAAGMGYRSVFYVTSAIVFFNFIWSLINFRKYLTTKEI